MLVAPHDLEQRLAVDAGDHHVPPPGLGGFVDQHQVTIEDAYPLQTVTAYARQIDLRAMQAEQFVEGDTLLDVILGRAGEAGRHAGEEIGNFGAAGRDRAEDADAGQGYYLN